MSKLIWAASYILNRNQKCHSNFLALKPTVYYKQKTLGDLSYLELIINYFLTTNHATNLSTPGCYSFKRCSVINVSVSNRLSWWETVSKYSYVSHLLEVITIHTEVASWDPLSSWLSAKKMGGIVYVTCLDGWSLQWSDTVGYNRPELMYYRPVHFGQLPRFFLSLTLLPSSQ